MPGENLMDGHVPVELLIQDRRTKINHIRHNASQKTDAEQESISLRSPKANGGEERER
jgi:hypothetical protein